MRILVAGGGGYIGGVLIPMLLGAGHEVRVLDRFMFCEPAQNYPGLEIIRGDVRDLKTVHEAMRGIETVLNLVSLRWRSCDENPLVAWGVNCTGARLLVLEAMRTGSKIVYSSTCSVYGDCDKFVDEETPVELTSVYAETKHEAEMSVFGVGGTVLRLATVYGLSPCMRYDTLINSLARDAALDGNLEIYAPDAWRPFVHVHDAARAFIWALDAPPGIFNVGGENLQKEDLATMLAGVLPGLVVKTVPKRDKRNYRASFRKIQKRGFFPERTVLSGVKEIVDMVRGK